MSEAFLRTVRGSHSIVTRARICTTFQTGTDPDGTAVSILDGQVTLDGDADVRSTLDLTIDGTGLWPRYVDDLIAPYGNEVFVQRGVQYGNGTEEMVSLGYFRIDTPGQGLLPDGPIRIAAPDRMQGLIDARLTAPRQYTSAATYGDVVDELVLDVYPAATVEWDDGTDLLALGRDLIAEEDRFGFLADLVTGRGKIWYWDYRGVLVVTDAPSVAEPVFDVDAGEGGVLVDVSRQLTRRGVYNAVVALGEAADTAEPVRAVAYDANPLSPTYFYGRFGPVPRFYSSPFITTGGQAETAAESLLRRQLGLPYTADFTAVPNVALEPYDPIRLRYSTRDAPEVHVLRAMSVPLVAQAPLQGTTREQTQILIASTS